ncbi:MAG: GGDEF domain-containing protein [Actinobacteria bacterium]|nr:GGDEF domain-containing protein [Actinomycetota bacterium]
MAGATVEETLRTGAAASLERLGRLGQLGSLPLVVEAVRESGDASAVVLAHAREREGFGFATGEVAAELLGLGRVLERRGETRAREALDVALLVLFESVTDDLAERARRDPLTGLLNHQAFHAAVAEETTRARRYRGRVALVAFDLDGFKRTNDTEGHQEGDRLLRAFAAALARTIRGSDRAGRLGGDEFAALLLQADSRAVHAFLDRLTRRLPRGVSTSAGAAFLTEVTGPPEQLFELADRRLYADKAARSAAA